MKWLFPALFIFISSCDTAEAPADYYTRCVDASECFDNCARDKYCVARCSDAWCRFSCYAGWCTFDRMEKCGF